MRGFDVCELAKEATYALGMAFASRNASLWPHLGHNWACGPRSVQDPDRLHAEQRQEWLDLDRFVGLCEDTGSQVLHEGGGRGRGKR